MRCYYVTDRKQAGVLAAARRAIDAGVEMIQVREKDLEAAPLLDLVSKILDMARNTPTRVLVNDRLDVALAAGAQGVHLPAGGLPVSAVRPHIDLIGASTHTLDEARRRAAEGADFIVFGPVWSTPGKTPVGVEELREVVRSIRIPVFAIGGVTAANAHEAIRAGAAGVAGIRMFQN